MHPRSTGTCCMYHGSARWMKDRQNARIQSSHAECRRCYLSMRTRPPPCRGRLAPSPERARSRKPAFVTEAVTLDNEAVRTRALGIECKDSTIYPFRELRCSCPGFDACHGQAERFSPGRHLLPINPEKIVIICIKPIKFIIFINGMI